MTLDFSKFDGLLPAVVTDSTTGRVLMVGFMNEAAWQRTLDSGNVTFYSRSRNKLWMKGESSGHVLKVREIRTDCDLDTVVISADNLGPGVCHDGYESCFYRRYDNGEWTTTDTKTYDPNTVYNQHSQPNRDLPNRDLPNRDLPNRDLPNRDLPNRDREGAAQESK